MAEALVPDTATPSTRQWLSKRQSATVDSLLDAGLEAIREVGFDTLSLRDVASRAGVTHTTAYNYFTSKEHLVAEIHWRLLHRLPVPDPDPTLPLGDRLTQVLRDASELLVDEPALAEAALGAMVARDPDIRRIRDTIGNEILKRIQIAVGPDADKDLLDGILLLYSGAMLQAGLGYFVFDDVVARIGQIANQWDANR